MSVYSIILNIIQLTHPSPPHATAHRPRAYTPLNKSAFFDQQAPFSITQEIPFRSFLLPGINSFLLSAYSFPLGNKKIISNFYPIVFL